MTVSEMLSDLRSRGYDVDAALVAISERPDVGKVEVVKAKYKRKAGTANKYSDGTFVIKLASKLWLTPGNAWNTVHETFIHELAHIFTQFTVDIRSHGPTWKGWCELFGIAPNQYHSYKHIGRKKLHVVAVCIDCTHEYVGRRRLNRRYTYSCVHCGGGIDKLYD